MIVKFPGWPSPSDEEIQEVTRVLKTGRVNYWTGENGRLFEEEFSDWSECSHSIAVANGTVSLELGLKALGLQKNDEVIVSPRSFIASVSSVISAGAIPVFADVDPLNGNLTAQTIHEKITTKTRAVIVVHLAGWPCEMESILKLASAHNLKVIEDCAQAHGAEYCGRKVGGIGDLGSWSFCQDKIMTTGGEGGMVTTNSRDLRDRIWSYKDHGKDRDLVYSNNHKPGFRWLHKNFGTNARLTEMQAAIGRVQLRKVRDWQKQREQNAYTLADIISNGSSDSITIPLPGKHIRHAFYRFYVYLNPSALKSSYSRNRITQEIEDAGVPCFQGSCSEIYLEKAFDGTGWRPEKRLPNAKTLGETSLCFLTHPTLKKEHMQHAGDIIVDVLKAATR